MDRIRLTTEPTIENTTEITIEITIEITTEESLRTDETPTRGETTLTQPDTDPTACPWEVWDTTARNITNPITRNGTTPLNTNLIRASTTRPLTDTDTPELPPRTDTDTDTPE